MALLHGFERPLMCASAAPAASQRVAVQVRENVAALADSPSINELLDALSPEGREVPLELVVSGHNTNGTGGSGSVEPHKRRPAEAGLLAQSLSGPLLWSLEAGRRAGSGRVRPIHGHVHVLDVDRVREIQRNQCEL